MSLRETLQTFKATFITSLPLAAIIIIVVLIAPMDNTFDYVRLAVGYAGVVIGQSLFLVGLEASVLPIGKEIGKSLAKIKKAVFVILFGVMFGFFATVAEPAMWVLARQTNMIVSAIYVPIFVTIMSAGVGVAVGFALYRIMKDINIRKVFFVLYIITFLAIAFVPEQFVALAFDGSGATTGDISVPFVLALGMGAATALSKRGEAREAGDSKMAERTTGPGGVAEEASRALPGGAAGLGAEAHLNEAHLNEDSFGIIGIASVGPILSVFLYGIVLRFIHGGMPPESVYNPGALPTDVAVVLGASFTDTLIALMPLLIAFVPFQFLLIKMAKKPFVRIMVGIIPVFAGLLIFLFSIDFGFAFAGQYIGEVFMDPVRPQWFRWLLLLVGFVLGVAITLTEPAVTVLGDQLEEMISIKSMTTRMTLAVGIGFSAMLAIVKIMYEINILWFIVPLYIVAVAMMKFTPKLFVGLAFDSGGVSGGALSSAVLTPLTLGIAQAVATAAIVAGQEAQSILTNGFGILAFISVTPLIAIQALGIVYSKRHKF